MAEQQLNYRVIHVTSAIDQTSAAALSGEDTSGQYLMQVNDGATGAFQPSGLDGVVVGVCQEKPAAGAEFMLALGDVVKIMLGDTVALAAPEVCSDANGRAIPVAANHNVYGQALTAGVVGDVVPVLVRPRYKA